MTKYDDMGFAPNLRKQTALSQRDTSYTNALIEDLKVEQSPYKNILISKGTVQTSGGGVAQLQSTTGGTILFTVDPVTGEVTITGPVVANVTVNFGSMNNSAITGTSSLMGTLTNSGIVSGGNINNVNIGTSRSVGGTANTIKLESPTFNVNPASNPLSSLGAFEIQSIGGSAHLVVRGTDGITYKFTPVGTIV